MSPRSNASTSDAQKSRRKPPRATLEQKIQILDYFHQLDRPQLETVDNFRHEVAISTSTFNEWLKHEHEYRQRYQALGTLFEKHARRKVTYKYDKINRAMDLLVQQRLARGEEVTEPVLRNYWQIYAHQFGVENPKRLIGFSHGWLSQFKKRHGLCRKKLGPPGDLTTSNNEKILADPASDDEPPSVPISVSVSGVSGAGMSRDPTLLNLLPEDDVPEPAGHFQPQSTLSFSQNIAYLLPPQPQTQIQQQQQHSGANSPRSRLVDRHRSRDLIPPVDLDELAELLARAMHLSLNTRKPFAAHDIERFLATVADRFFQDHQYDYPQTVHLYEEFKSLFASERLINLRSAQEARLKDPPRGPRSNSLGPPSLGPAMPGSSSSSSASSSAASSSAVIATSEIDAPRQNVLLLLDPHPLRARSRREVPVHVPESLGVSTLHGLRSSSGSGSRALSMGPATGNRHGHVQNQRQHQHQQHQQHHRQQHQRQHRQHLHLHQHQQINLQHGFRHEEAPSLNTAEQSIETLFLRQATGNGLQSLSQPVSSNSNTSTHTHNHTHTNTNTNMNMNTNTNLSQPQHRGYDDGEKVWLNSELRRLWEQNKLMLS